MHTKKGPELSVLRCKKTVAMAYKEQSGVKEGKLRMDAELMSPGGVICTGSAN